MDPTGVDSHLTEPMRVAEHRALTALYESFKRALQIDDAAHADLWAQFDAGLLAHLDAEEQTQVFELYKSCPRDARVLITEHNHIRARLIELRAARALGNMPTHVADNFYHELCAQMRREESVLYRSAAAGVDGTRIGATDDAPAYPKRDSE
jgi:hypothetical protein